jgi:hypothetical protein|tara:strand:- start:84 stop:404 length:321 start_codon:yes stop_codon:yes gene_type:complete
MWTEDPDVWEALDDLMINAWPMMNKFLSSMKPHRSELPDLAKGLLYGALGQFAASYNEARHESNKPEHAVAIATQAVMKNPSFQVIMNNAIDGMVDNKVEEMKGDF